MRRSDRYILRELITPFLAGTFLVLMLVTSGKLYNDLQWLRESHASLSEIVRNILVLMPQYLTLSLPVSTALAASLATSRLARDNEITVLRALGRPIWRIFLPVLFFGSLVSAADLWIADRLVPWSIKTQRAIASGQNQAPLYQKEPGRTLRVENFTLSFLGSQRTAPDTRRVERIVFVNNRSLGQTGHEVITADWAEYGGGVWKLHQAVRHKYDRSGVLQTEKVTGEDKLPLFVDFSAVYQNTLGGSDEYTFAELSQRAREARRLGNFQDALDNEVNRWFRLSLPAMAFVFALCAPPLALRFARTGSFAGIMLSVVTVFVGWNTLLFMKSVGWGGLLPPVVCAWTTNVLFTILGLWLLRTQE